jgi:hypothetical protein
MVTNGGRRICVAALFARAGTDARDFSARLFAP